MNMKRLVLTSCLIGVGGFISAAAMADSVKPGQRMIYDNRVPDEAPQLNKPIFNKRIIAPKQAPAQNNEDDADRAQGNEAPQPSGQAGTEPETQENDADPKPSLYVAPDQNEDEATPQSREEAGDDETGAEQEGAELDLNGMSPRKRRKLENIADDFVRNMPHKDITAEQFENLPPEEQKRVQNEIQTYADKNSARVKKELDDE